MKTTRILMVVAFLAAVSQPIFADGPVRVPDGGATAVLLGLGVAGLVAARGVFKKK